MKNSYFNQQLQSNLENTTSQFNGASSLGRGSQNSPRRVANDTNLQLSQRVTDGINKNLERERNNQMEELEVRV